MLPFPHYLLLLLINPVVSVCGLISAHARLMFRGEAIQADAIAAVVCVESSMMTSAILDGMGNALHSSFADNPDEECILKVLYFSP